MATSERNSRGNSGAPVTSTWVEYGEVELNLETNRGRRRNSAGNGAELTPAEMRALAAQGRYPGQPVQKRVEVVRSIALEDPQGPDKSPRFTVGAFFTALSRGRAKVRNAENGNNGRNRRGE